MEVDEHSSFLGVEFFFGTDWLLFFVLLVVVVVVDISQSLFMIVFMMS